jgi:D-threo-aldose 1-dehydrogenase
VFNSGLLARRSPGRGAKYNYVEASPELLERTRAIAIVCERYGTTLPAAALAFAGAHPAVVSVCVGARSATQIERNAALSRKPIPRDVWAELKATGLLREDAPLPDAEDDRP